VSLVSDLHVRQHGGVVVGVSEVLVIERRDGVDDALVLGRLQHGLVPLAQPVLAGHLLVLFSTEKRGVQVSEY
jgi:hypothetical protein